MIPGERPRPGAWNQKFFCLGEMVGPTALEPSSHLHEAGSHSHHKALGKRTHTPWGPYSTHATLCERQGLMRLRGRNWAARSCLLPTAWVLAALRLALCGTWKGQWGTLSGCGSCTPEVNLKCLVIPASRENGGGARRRAHPAGREGGQG